MNQPTAIAVDGIGNIYITDTWNDCVRKVDTSGIISTVMDRASIGGYYLRPVGVEANKQGDLFVSDDNNEVVWKMLAGSTIATRIAGTGVPYFSGDGGSARNAAISAPSGLALDSQGSLLIADWGNARVRKIGGAPPPQINSTVPSSGTSGTVITITGVNFGESQGSSTVTFNGEKAFPTSWSNTAIIVPVPLIRTTSMNGIVVTVGGTASSAMPFSVIPKIDALDPSWGEPGTAVTIIGSGFGMGYSNSTVTFNGIPAVPVIQENQRLWTPTGIAVTVPAGDASGPVIVTVDGFASNGAVFTVTPVIYTLSPVSGQAGALVTIDGSNFGASQGTGTVTFNGVIATINSWTASQIVVTVPAEATTGPVVVTLGGATSNGIAFTVAPSVVITHPLDGAAINRPDTVVTGRILAASGEVAVKVNGQLAMVNGQDFAINAVNLVEGSNVITAALTDASGFATTASITVNTYSFDGHVKLTTSLEAGLAAMEPKLTLATSLPSSIAQIDMIVDGPAPGSFTAIEFPFALTIPSPGIHLATVTVRTSTGYRYEDKIALNVLDPSATEALFNAKWNAMWSALLGGNMDGAMQYVASSSQARYRSIFTELQTQLSSVFSGIEGFHLLWVRDNAAEAEAIRTENGEIFSYPITLDCSETGFWKMVGF